MSRLRGAILTIALPAIASNITTPLLGLADVAVVGHIGDAAYLGAIAMGGNAINMFYWVFSFLRMGSSGMTAQAFGAGMRSQCDIVLWRGLVIAAALSAVILSLQGLAADAVLGFMDAGARASGLARDYFMVMVWGSPAVLATNVLAGWFLGLQDSRSPMWVALASNVLNIGASLVFVFAIKLDVRGVALGTVVAQWAGLGLAALLAKRRYGPRLPHWHQVWDWKGLKRFFGVNLFIFLRTVCLVCVTLWFTHAGALEGDTVLAANSVLLQFFLLFSYFIDGFAYAGEAIAGRCVGAGDTRSLRRSVKAILRVGLWLAAGFSMAYFLLGTYIVSLLSSDPHVVLKASEYLWWTVSIPLAGFGAFAWDGIFAGMTLTRGMMASMAGATAVFFGLYYLLKPELGNHGLWASFVAYLATRALLQTLIYRHYIRRNMHCLI